MKSLAFLLFCLFVSRAGTSGLDNDDGKGDALTSSEDELLLVEKRQVDNTMKDTGYIVNLEVTCALNSTLLGELRVRADVPAYAMARCGNGDQTFNDSLDPLHTLVLAMPGGQTPAGQYCLMKAIAGSKTYKVVMEIGWGEANSEIMQYRRQELVTCSYDSYGFHESANHTVTDFVIAPKESLTLNGLYSNETFSLHVVNVLDRPIDGINFGIGRKIRLRASVTGSVSMRAISCDAKNNANATYSVLRGGCGDGAIFPKNAGFHSENQNVFSPWFQAFKLRGSNDIRFECIFIRCAGCTGSSCV